MTDTSPPSLEDRFEQALASYQAGELQAALTLCQSILAESPDFFDCLHLAGILSTQTGHLEQGLGFLDRAIRLKPHVQLTYYNRYLALQKLQRPKEALAVLDQAIELLPENPTYWSSRGHLLLELNRPQEALDSFNRLCAIEPDSHDAHFQRARALKILGQTQEALAAYDQALRLKPDFADAWNNRGNIFLDLGHHELALTCSDKALALEPNSAAFWSNRGILFQQLNRPEESLACYEQAIRNKPDEADTYYMNKSFVLLLKGCFSEGWSLYESRWKALPQLPEEPDFPSVRWSGKEDIAGKTILLYFEQGLGDTLQFCRYAPLLKARGARVILEAPQALRRVLSGLSGVDDWVSSGTSRPPFNMHCPLMSLPLAFQTFREADIPADIPYLFSDPELVTQWGKKLGTRTRPRVGLVWNGGHRPNQPDVWGVNARRNIPFSLIARINHPDIDFYSLQKGEPAESELLRLEDEHWSTDNLHILTADIHDFADTAALIMNLDLVIAVDTSVLHLAAALGKPVWLLNRFDTCWRWLLEREDSPWYPTIKIYRQTRFGEWGDVIERVRADLDTQIALHHKPDQGQATEVLTVHPEPDQGQTPPPLETWAAEQLQQAVTLYHSGLLDEAEKRCLSILLRQDKHAETLHMLGVLAGQRGDTQAAIAYLQDALTAFPEYALAHSNLAGLLSGLNRLEEAETHYAELVRHQPDFADAHKNRGNVLRRLKRLEDALLSYNQAIRLRPDHAETHFGRAIVLAELQRPEAALASYDEAIRCKPDYVDAYLNRGVILQELRQVEAAVESFRSAIRFNPNDAEAYSNLGDALKNCLRLDEAIASYDQAIRSQPDKADPYRWNKSLVLLLTQNFAEGWLLYESRWALPSLQNGTHKLPSPMWLGRENIAGKTILLYSEQGLGDTLQFCRYASLLKARGAKVILEVPKTLREVLSGLSGVDYWVSPGESPPPFNMHCPLLSLPLAFKTFSEAAIPADIPYLFADPARVAEWDKKLGQKKRPRVGIVWNGGFRPDQPEVWKTNERRNIPFPLFARINHPDIDFYSLQKGDPAESELLRIKDEYWPTDNLHIHTTDIHDFADTAALITHLDLVIAVDTSTLHLAAALGKPVWLLNRLDTCWRWMLEREDSPWYPTLKIYRQTRYGEWGDVLERVRAELNTLLTQTPPVSLKSSTALSFDKLYQKAARLYQADDLEEAIRCYDHLLALQPNHSETWNNRGIALKKLRRLDEALSSYEEAIRFQPDLAKAHYNRGNTLTELGELQEALSSYDRALALKPDYTEAWNNRCNVLMQQGRLDEALASLDRAIALDPHVPDTWKNRGSILALDKQRQAEALTCFDRAISLSSSDVDAYRFDKSTALLLQGDFVQGWPLFELRWEKKVMAGEKKNYPLPLWLGESDISGKTVLIWGEQGSGDTFQFCRYAPLLAARGAKVIFGIEHAMHKVLAGLQGVEHWVGIGDQIPLFDLHCPLMSLPLACKTFREADIPADIPYLSADPVLVTEWGKKLGKKKRPRVGMVWNGGFRPHHPDVWKTNERRNIPFAQIARLNHPEMDFYSLQKGEPAESELLRLKDEHWPTNNLHIHTDDIHDFADTAALIMNLDLVIAVDTAVMHLAAALGKPVWLLNRFDTCWRWMLEREDSPWYPTMKIYRQTRYGQWGDVIERVRTDLNTLAFVPAKEPRTTKRTGSTKRPGTTKRTGAATTKPGHRPSAGKT